MITDLRRVWAERVIIADDNGRYDARSLPAVVGVRSTRQIRSCRRTTSGRCRGAAGGTPRAAP
ncbi:hypothetical protein [Amycolatopsis sp. NPDC051372]|uniref:hypothetical protein n=1 Tax=unclassified Amycolatopsis TaxID=2618356 RepID=UPI00342AD42B